MSSWAWKLWRFLNSRFFLTCFGGIIVGLATFSYTRWSDELVAARRNRQRLNSLKVEIIDRLEKSGIYDEKDEKTIRQDFGHKDFVENCFFYLDNIHRNGTLLHATRAEYNDLSFVAVVQDYYTVLEEVESRAVGRTAAVMDSVIVAHKLIRKQSESLHHGNPRIAPDNEALIKSVIFLQKLPGQLNDLVMPDKAAQP